MKFRYSYQLRLRIPFIKLNYIKITRNFILQLICLEQKISIREPSITQVGIARMTAINWQPSRTNRPVRQINWGSKSSSKLNNLTQSNFIICVARCTRGSQDILSIIKCHIPKFSSPNSVQDSLKPHANIFFLRRKENLE